MLLFYDSKHLGEQDWLSGRAGASECDEFIAIGWRMGAIVFFSLQILKVEPKKRGSAFNIICSIGGDPDLLNFKRVVRYVWR
jgi:hypothetical protein